MPVTASNKSTFEPIPAGVYVGICYCVIDIGTHYDQTFDRRARRVWIGWEIPELRLKFKDKDGNDKEGPRVQGSEFTLSLNEKGKLKPFLESWRGRPFTAQELNGFDVGKLIGAPGQLNIIVEDKNGKTRNKISTIMRLPKGMTAPNPELPTINFSLDDLTEPKLPVEIPEWLQKKIVVSDEYSALCKRHAEPTEPEPTSPGPEDAAEDDVPF